MKNHDTNVNALARMSHINAYSNDGAATKRAFHSKGRAFLRALAKEIGAADFDIRSNQGGIAVSGEVTLHTPRLYVQLSESCVGGGGVGILFRTCNSKRDYCGGTNNWSTMERLRNGEGSLERFVEACARMEGRTNG